MKNTLIAAVAACTGMLVTSGLVAYAVAGPSPDDEAEAYISQMIDRHWHATMDAAAEP